VLSLGRVEGIDQRYHDAECIYPIGYRAARSEPMADLKDSRRAPLRQTLLCEVISSAQGPSFQVRASQPTPVSSALLSATQPLSSLGAQHTQWCAQRPQRLSRTG